MQSTKGFPLTIAIKKKQANQQQKNLFGTVNIIKSSMVVNF